MLIRFLAPVLLCLGPLAQAPAQAEWEKVPYQHWGVEEVRKILSDSPWGRTVTRSESIAPLWLGTDAPKLEGNFVFLLRSALPVRQALLRRRQLEAKYDRMGEAERAEFDKKNKALLECPACARNYVISFNSKNRALTNTSFGQKGKGSIYLENDRGERREAVHFMLSGEGGDNEAHFFFPRLDEKGNPLLTPESKKLTFYLGVRNSTDYLQLPEKVEFDVTKLVRGGQVIF